MILRLLCSLGYVLYFFTLLHVANYLNHAHSKRYRSFYWPFCHSVSLEVAYDNG